jgi:replication-associated recombination protein RarA
LDFECSEDELILVDEADQYIFNQDQLFMTLIENRSCICVTATPTNKDSEDAE